MALDVPTTQEVSDQIVAHLEAALSQTIPLLPKSFSRVLAKTLAGVLIIIYRYAGWIFLQMFVRYAQDEETIINGIPVNPLVEWGRLIGVGDPTAAVQAEYVIDVTVENQVGNLNQNAQLIRQETGVVYLTTSTVALSAPTVQVTIRASSDPDGGDGSGTIGNLQVDDVVSFANPLPNVAREATVASESVTGADRESTEDYRQRILDRFQSRPQGGAYSDYRVWGSEVAGIEQIYPYTGSPGEVDVYVLADTTTDPDGIPTAAQLTAVADAIELDVAGLATRRPAGAAVNVLPITRTGFAITITGLSPDTTETRDLIETAADEYFRSREPFITGLSVLPSRNRILEGEFAGIVHGIAHAQGATVTTVEIDPGPAYTLGDGELAKWDGGAAYE